MALDPSNNSNLEQLALKGLIAADTYKITTIDNSIVTSPAAILLCTTGPIGTLSTFKIAVPNATATHLLRLSANIITKTKTLYVGLNDPLL